MSDTTKFNELFLKYQNIFNKENNQNMIFSGSFDCDKKDDIYYLIINFVGRKDGFVVHSTTKDYVISEHYIKTMNDKTLHLKDIYFKNIIDDLDMIYELSRT
jgi:hypothetical protein